jgi:hypothetical protein
MYCRTRIENDLYHIMVWPESGKPNEEGFTACYVDILTGRFIPARLTEQENLELSEVVDLARAKQKELGYEPTI